MNSREAFSRNFSRGILISFVITMLLSLWLAWSNNHYEMESTVILASNFVIMLCYFFAISGDNFDIFHTIHLITLLFLGIFVYTPLLLIEARRTDSFGIDVMPGCIPATIIFTVSYFAFVVGYTKAKFKMNFNYVELPVVLQRKILKYSWIIWIIALALSFFYLLKTGRSVRYILTFGSEGSIKDETTDLLFLSNFSLCMIVPLMYIFKFQKNKLLFLIPMFLTFAVFYIRGFRIFIMILIIGLFLFYFKSNAKKPSLGATSIFLIGLFAFNTLLGGIRSSLRLGQESEVSLQSDDFLYTLESNFDIYKPYYGLVAKYPKYYDFTLGKSTIFDTFAMWVPRSMWKEKPLAEDNVQARALRNSVNDFAFLEAKLAWPNIAEYYLDFGPPGCIILFFIFGYYSKKLHNLYYSKQIYHLVAYSVSYTLLLQFVIRGALALFVPFLVFTLLPYYIIYKLLLKPGRV